MRIGLFLFITHELCIFRMDEFAGALLGVFLFLLVFLGAQK